MVVMKTYPPVITIFIVGLNHSQIDGSSFFLLAMLMIISPTKNLEYNSRHFVLWYCDLLGYDLFIFFHPVWTTLDPYPQRGQRCLERHCSGGHGRVKYLWLVPNPSVSSTLYINIHIPITYYYIYIYMYIYICCNVYVYVYIIGLSHGI